MDRPLFSGAGDMLAFARQVVGGENRQRGDDDHGDGDDIGHRALMRAG